MLNNGGESGHPCHVPDLRKKALSIFPHTEDDIHCVVFIYSFYDIEVCSLCPYTLKSFDPVLGTLLHSGNPILSVTPRILRQLPHLGFHLHFTTWMPFRQGCPSLKQTSKSSDFVLHCLYHFSVLAYEAPSPLRYISSDSLLWTFYLAKSGCLPISRITAIRFLNLQLSSQIFRMICELSLWIRGTRCS